MSKKTKPVTPGSPLQATLQPGDPIKARGPRPGFIKQEAPKELKSNGWTILRHRTSRAESRVETKALCTAEVGIPLKKARELIDASDAIKKRTKLCLESIEDFEAIMANPDWLIKDKASRIEMIVGTMHARLTLLKTHLE